MKNLRLKNFLWIVLGMSAICWWSVAWLKGIDLSNLWNFVSLIPDVIFADGILFWAFTKWGWKIKAFQGWLVPFPDLNGTWEGVIQSDWVNPKTNLKIDPIPVLLTIKQNFFCISCVMRTAEMTSYSYAEDFKLDEERQTRQLVYSYTSKPKLTMADRSSFHYGTIMFDIVGKPISKLKGQYWTSRKTVGEITLKFRQKELLDELPGDFGQHPMDQRDTKGTMGT